MRHLNDQIMASLDLVHMICINPKKTQVSKSGTFKYFPESTLSIFEKYQISYLFFRLLESPNRM